MNKLGAYKKKIKNIDNIKARYALLLKGLDSPDIINSKMAKSLESQRSFAALCVEGSKIETLSLNTMKSLADDLYGNEPGFDRGFEFLDSFRLKLHRILENRTGSRTLAGKAARFSKRTDQMTKKIRELELQDILKAKAYLDLYGSINTIIKEAILDDDTRQRFINLRKDHQDLYGSIFSPSSSRIDGCGKVILQIVQNNKKS